MKRSKVDLDFTTHAILSEAQSLAGIARLDFAIGALLLNWCKNEDPTAVAEDMIAGVPDYMIEANKKLAEPEAPPVEKKRRKARPPGATARKGTA